MIHATTNTPERQARALRAKGTAFEICYAPRAEPRQHKVKQKTGPKPQRTAREKTIAALRDNTGNPFTTIIPTAADTGKTARIRGRSA